MDSGLGGNLHTKRSRHLRAAFHFIVHREEFLKRLPRENNPRGEIRTERVGNQCQASCDVSADFVALNTISAHMCVCLRRFQTFTSSRCSYGGNLISGIVFQLIKA